MSTHPYKDSRLPVAERVSDLLGRMTLQEKIAQMYSHWLILSAQGEHRMREDTFAQRTTSDAFKEMLKAGMGTDHAAAWHPSCRCAGRGARSQRAAEVSRRRNPSRHPGNVS